MKFSFYLLHLRSYFYVLLNGVSLIGNISIKDGVPFVHTHITFSDTEYKVFGGHLFDAKITATGEIILMVADSKIDRQFNENVGIHTWCLSENN